MARWVLTACFSMALAGVVGCGAAGQAKHLNDLRQTGLAYHNHHDLHQKGPANWDELIATDKGTGGDGAAIARVRDAGYQMQWDAKFSELTAGMSETVMASHPNGGAQLMMDGSVRQP